MIEPVAERLFWRETFRQIMGLLTKSQLGVARLRLEGVPEETIAQMLDISADALRLRMHRAALRIVGEMPEMAHFFRGRNIHPQRSRGSPLPLERGWVCHDLAGLPELDAAPVRYSPVQVAESWQVDARTVRDWCRRGMVPGAFKQGNRWLIPEEAVVALRPSVEYGCEPM